MISMVGLGLPVTLPETIGQWLVSCCMHQSAHSAS